MNKYTLRGIIALTFALWAIACLQSCTVESVQAKPADKAVITRCHGVKITHSKRLSVVCR